MLAVLLVSCKTSDKFSVHTRRYNPGFYFEKNSTAAKVAAAKSNVKKQSAVPMPQKAPVVIASDLTASNTVNKISSGNSKRHSNRSKTYFNELLINHISRVSESLKVVPVLHKALSTQLLKSRKAAKESKKSYSPLGSLVAYILGYIGIALIITGFFLILSGLGGNTLDIVGGIVLIIIGLIFLSLMAMASFGAGNSR